MLALAKAVQAQCDNISNLAVFCSLVVAQFAHLEHYYGVLQTSQMTSLFVVGFFASSILDLCNCYIFLTVKLHSKQAPIKLNQTSNM